jgi:hypothetical protein
LVVVTLVPVPFVKVRPWREVVPVTVRLPTVAEPRVADAAVTVAPDAPLKARTDANKLVVVTAVAVTFAMVTLPSVVWPLTDRKEPERLVNCPFVANRLVVVTLVAVAFARMAFHRNPADPSDKAASIEGRRLVETTPDTARPVVVTLEPWALVKERPWREVEPKTVNVEVTVEEAATNPPRNWRVAVAEEPRAVTEARVSVLAAEAGQPTPFARQTAWPITVAVAKLPAKAYTEDPDAVPKPNHPVDVPLAKDNEDITAAEAWRFCANRLVEVVFVPVALVQMRFANEDGAFPVSARDVAVTDPNVAFVEETLENCPFVANRLVVVTEVAVPFVNVSDCREVVPVAVRFPTVAEPMVAPASVSEVPAPVVKLKPCKEVVPVAVNPPTSAVENVPFEAWTEEAKSVEPVALVKVNACSEAVPVAVRLPTVEAKAYSEFANRLVVVTDVAVALASTAFQRSEAEPSERAASIVGIREVETPPSTARPVVVTLEPWAFVKDRP